MAAKPIRVFWSPLGRRFYASAHYRIMGKTENFEHIIITGKKFDVTDDIAAATIKHKITFRAERKKKS